MLRCIALCIAVLLCSKMLFAQFDTIRVPFNTSTKLLEEVVVMSQRSLYEKAFNPLSTLDGYLEKVNSVNLIRRGTYALEPFLNGMASERSVITIDGMRIYAACTDKMDPVTSYVEITNLAKANIHNGSSGSISGASIAGNLDLIRKKIQFGKKELKGNIFTGLETNNQQKILGGSLTYSCYRFFTDIDFTFRNAENYKAGGGKEVLYSQFTKYNVSAVTGYKINEHEYIEASLIYDHAINVGYPSLTMDVSKARALVGSAEYVRKHISSAIEQWQTKIYYNDVKHIMDDTKRPIVPIRMDMPGWSKTAGLYSRLEGSIAKHRWKANLSWHHNKSLAEMTMYSNIPGEKDMFMLTWPGIHTNYADIYSEDIYSFAKSWTATFNVGIAIHSNQVKNSFGLESLKIFYPDMQKTNTRLLKRISSSFKFVRHNWQLNVSLGYSERAPSISEGYGFYLFNSFDRFDYIGNPSMRNEKSLSLDGTISYNKERFSAKLYASNFYIVDYIIGRPHTGLSVMTIGGAGVKVYEQLKYANIFNSSLDLNYQFNNNWLWRTRFSYRMGFGKDVGHLPLIQPFSFSSTIAYSLKSFAADISVNGADKRKKFNSEFGESAIPAYAIINLSVSNLFILGKQSLLLKAGVENLLDKRYSTFADWNRLPRMGRNIFVNIIWNI